MRKHFNRIFVCFIVCIFLFGLNKSYSQVCAGPATNNCFSVTDPGLTPSRFVQSPTPNNVDFVFDNLSKYISGITYYGSTVLKLVISPQNVNCKWRLVMSVDNNGAPGNEWETNVTYGMTGSKPQVSLIQVRVTNNCGTPEHNGTYQVFANKLTELNIINSIILNPYACNGTEVNSAGTYLSNQYGAYSFTIDYRIIPTSDLIFKPLDLRPGNYQFQIKFCLVED
jgi:hypothetical protein